MDVLLTKEQVKIGSDFITELVKDLNKIFHVYNRIDINKHGISIRTNRYKKPKIYNNVADLYSESVFNFKFNSHPKGCSVTTTSLGYYSPPKGYEHIKSLGHLCEKYEPFGTTTNFSDGYFTKAFYERNRHIYKSTYEEHYKELPNNWVNFNIPIIPTEENHLDLFNDLVYIMEYNDYKKRIKK